MAISWGAKKQLNFFAVFALVVVIILVIILIKFLNPTCFDGKQNQGEQGVDCGGSCQPCVGEVKDPVVLWSKAFKIKDGEYEAAALIDNPNIFAGISSFKYKLKIYDEKNILIALKEGESFINPNEKKLIFETNIETGKRVPKKAFIEFEENFKWKRIEKEKPQLVVSGKQFFYEPFPKLAVEISNKSSFGIKDIFASTVLYDGNKNALAVSVSKIDYIGGGSNQEIVFTWPEPLPEVPDSSEVFVNINSTQ
jgi:hypothetical protein